MRWYRRASRERRQRETTGAAVAAVLGELRGVASPEALRGHYREHDGDRAAAVVARLGLGEGQRADLRQVEDAAHGLRWIEIAHGRKFDLGRSLVPQLPLALLDGASDALHFDEGRRVVAG